MSSSSSSQSSIFGFQRWTSIYEAKRLLNLSNTITNTNMKTNNKEAIEIAFRNAAKMYHPDSTSINSQPCPIKFRQCLEARDLLLRELIPQTTTRPPARGTNYSSYSAPNHPYRYKNCHHRNKKDYFGKGFPFQTLKLLTLKQKLIIRGSIMILVTLGALYDRNLRIKIQQHKQQQQQRLLQQQQQQQKT